ncbi:hypothetical protein BGX34_001501 [Mortierella sp. NVP85]|nr:hypothetical protein BGX34_001501 [Mortierella sp. NVP85]
MYMVFILHHHPNVPFIMMLKDNQASPHCPLHPALSSSGTLSETPVYNILLLGATQSGKSTLLEFIKQYADPSYVANRSRIGYGNESHTRDVHVEVVPTTLPVYKLFDLNDGNREFDATRLKDEKSFKRFLFRDDDLELRAEEAPGSTEVQFRVFDTPGLNDTMNNDINNIAKIFPALSAIDNFHLIVIMDSHPVPLFPSQKSAFNTYFDLFEDFKSLMTVVHTNTPNHHRLPGLNKLFDTKLRQRSEFFNRIAGREVPTVRIDCDLDETGPAHLCMTRNAIRDILEIATIKPPVAKEMARVRKMPKMLAVDKKLRKNCKSTLNHIRQSCQTEADRLEIDIEFTELEIETRKELIQEHDTDELLLLFEERFDEGMTFFNWINDFFGRAEREHTMTLPEQTLTIDHLAVAQQAIQILRQSGGRGQKEWSVRFKRHAHKSGYYHAILSVYKRNKYKEAIDCWKKQLDVSTRRLKSFEEDLSVLKGIVKNGTIDPIAKSSPSCPFEQMRRKAVGYRKILDFATDKTLSLDLFLELADAGIYQGGDTDHQVQVLEEHLAKKFGVYV